MLPVDETHLVPDAPDAATPITRTFGKYRVVALVGSGATGSVFRAHDGDREVAIKVLHPTDDPDVRTRFLNEARAARSVQHPNILAVHDVDDSGKSPFLVMELAERSLRDVMRGGKLDVETALAVGMQIGSALAAAHAAGILHRDVKPANILRAPDGTWKLADFGIARLPDSTLTDTGKFLGSPSYAAPESLRAGLFTPASDMYALAATLYEALAGAPPHGTHDMPSVVRKLEQDPPPLQFRCAVPRHIADAIMDALARDPSLRPNASTFMARLAPMLAEGSAPVVVEVPAPAPRVVESPVAKLPPPIGTNPAPAPTPRRFARTAIAAALGALCLLVIALRARFGDDAAAGHHYASPSRVDRAPTKPSPAPKLVDPVPLMPENSPIPTIEDDSRNGANGADGANGGDGSSATGADGASSQGEGMPPLEVPPDPPAEAAFDPWNPPAQIADDDAQRWLRDMERDARRTFDHIRRPPRHPHRPKTPNDPY